jgi:hypothetical protein
MKGLSPALAALIMFSGCTEQIPTAVLDHEAGPSKAMVIPWDGLPAAEYPSVESIPHEFRFATIYDWSTGLVWTGGIARGSGYMAYRGNRATIRHHLHITGTHGGPASPQYYPKWHWLPTSYDTHTAQHTFAIPSHCGHAANLTTRYSAQAVFFVVPDPSTRFFVTVSAPPHQLGVKEAFQPECEPCDPGGRPPRVTSAEYDPYAHQQGCDPSGGGGWGGSGTQYDIGDYTGGELVSWDGAIGIGGESACGSGARVEYVCIDYWDGTQWVHWACGYVTHC